MIPEPLNGKKVGKSNTAKKFWDRVDMSAGPNGCWPWKLSVNEFGYGKASWQGKQYLANRVAFLLANGGWPMAHACHSCDNPPCCNPAHLFDATHAENQADKARKGRGNKKLTIEQVKEIRSAGVARGSFQDFAAQYGVSYSTIRDIRGMRERKYV